MSIVGPRGTLWVATLLLLLLLLLTSWRPAAARLTPPHGLLLTGKASEDVKHLRDSLREDGAGFLPAQQAARGVW